MIHRTPPLTLRMLTILSALAGFLPVVAAGDGFDDLASCIPADANALILIDVEKTLQAPVAQQQGWGRTLEAAYVERPVFLPPEATKLAIGGRLDFRNDFVPMWEVAVIETPAAVAMRSLAMRDRGYVETVNGAETAWTAANTAYFQLPNNVLGVVARAERQFVSRVIGQAQNAAPASLSEYLQQALKLVNDRVQILFMIDLTDAASPRRMEDRLRQASWLKSSDGDPAVLAKLLAGVRGAALRVAVGSDCQCQLQVDFRDDVSSHEKIVKDALLQTLAELGMATDELAKWSFSAKGRQLLAQGKLSTDGQRRLFSVLEIPPTDLNPAGDAGNSEPSESERRERSLVYFASTEELLKDLRSGLKDSKATSAWMERYARRIDDLPVLYVDDELLEYGDKLAETLRIMSLSKRQAGIRSGVRRSEGAGYYYDYDAYERNAQASAARRQEMAVASDAIVEGWGLIDDATADVRRNMTQKYQAEF